MTNCNIIDTEEEKKHRNYKSTTSQGKLLWYKTSNLLKLVD